MHPPIKTVNRFPDSWDHAPYRGGNAYLPHPRPRAGYAAMIAELDDHVGRVVSAIKKAGLMDRTVIIFTSDNGTTHEGRGEPDFHIGGVDALFFNSTLNLRGYKGSVYEGGVNVPMVISGKSVSRMNSTDDSILNTTDLFATIANIAGISINQINDSNNFTHLFLNNDTAVRNHSFAQSEKDDGTSDYAIRNATHKYILFNDTSEAFYDLSANELENPNLLDSSLSTEENIIKDELTSQLSILLD